VARKRPEVEHLPREQVYRVRVWRGGGPGWWGRGQIQVTQKNFSFLRPSRALHRGSYGCDWSV